MVLLIILVYLIIGVIEITPLVKRNQKKELILYTITFMTAFIISLLLSLGVKIPSPAKPIEKIVKMVIG
ncbi:hypothetical protein FQB35_01895 [Crassaminicella thermophila]|uniref:Uncharacterized protein n=1 Tax=Crassaminicella thermophila TaxID=2599308 RepID=A0A5C0SE34_CRATE|nr:hypothetical protein [Crassaminicella thermophila]QEK11219.1 hypothetical protein FQB35_01895 [Crassaminicella thermophila]